MHKVELQQFVRVNHFKACLTLESLYLHNPIYVYFKRINTVCIAAVDNNGVYYYDPAMEEGMQILSLDVPLVLPVTESRPPSPFAVPLKPIREPITGMTFNIYNNIWNTNYIYWYPFHDEDRNFKARFTHRHYLDSSKK